MNDLHILRNMLCKELKEYAKEDKLSFSALEVVDKLAHAVKNIDKIIKKDESEEYSGHYMEPRRYPDRYSEKRDSMGRYSRDDEMIAELRELHRMSNDDMTRKQIEKIITIAESM